MYLKVDVTAEAREEKLTVISKDHLEISVREKAERNEANRRVLDLVKRHFKATRVRLVSGHHSSGKIINVDLS